MNSNRLRDYESSRVLMQTLLAISLASSAAGQDFVVMDSQLPALDIEAVEPAVRSPPSTPGRFYGDVQFMFLRLESSYDLEDQFKLAPRAVLGFENGAGLRARYWQYEYLVPAELSEDDLNGFNYYTFYAQRFNFQAVDLEFTGRFQGQYTDAQIGGGIRWASLDMDTIARSYHYGYYYDDYYPDPQDYTTDTHEASIDLLGPTFAVDGRTRLWRGLAGVYGGRMSVIGGTWSKDDFWYNPPGRDTYFVPEIYAGVELSYGHMLARFVYEYQHWQSKMHHGHGSTVSFDGIGCHVGFTY